MKSMKKILSLLLAVVLVVGCMTVAVWAEGEVEDHQHLFVVRMTYVPATCQSLSYVIYGCSHEGCTATRAQWGEGLGDHQYVKNEKESVAPTCEKEGKEISYCSVCKEKQEKVLSALNHDFTVKGETIAPTCEEDGYTKYTCSRCDTDKTENKDFVPATGHEWDDGVVTAPTCTDKGYTTYTCKAKDCNATKKENFVDTLSHSWDSGVVTAPTCTDKGYTTYTCTTCHATKTEGEQGALGHNWDAWYVVQLEEGKSIHKRICARCKAEEMGDHYFTQWGTEKVHGFFEDGLSGRHCVICNHRETKVIYSTVNRVLYSAEGFGLFLLSVALSPINWILKWANPALYEKITAILSPGK